MKGMIEINNFSDKKISIYTLGCRVSKYESDVIAQRFEEKGYTICEANEKCSAFVVNTCAVTAESSRKSGQIIRRLIRNNPDAFCAVIGCFSQTEPEKIMQIKGVDYAVGTENKLSVIEKTDEFFKNGMKKKNAEININKIPIDAKFECMSLSHTDRSRAYIKIEDGCNGKCTYCTIKDARGPVRSKPFNDVINEVKALAKNGYAEVVLTGIETAAYEYGLAELICEIEKIDGIKRIRLGSLDPAYIKKDFVDKIAECKKIMPHFHISLQSGSNNILKLMKRKYNIKTAYENLCYLRKAIPDTEFSADIITGFPGESEEDFKQTVEFVRKIKFLHLHVFPYSERKGTEAITFPGMLDKKIRQDRANELIAIGKEINLEILQKLESNAKVYEVIEEEIKDDLISGHLPCFADIYFKDAEYEKGKLINIKPIEVKEGKLYGEIIKE